MKRYFRDFYGSTACITAMRSGEYKLSVSAGGKRTTKTYATERGAKIALGKYSDAWREVTK